MEGLEFGVEYVVVYPQTNRHSDLKEAAFFEFAAERYHRRKGKVPDTFVVNPQSYRNVGEGILVMLEGQFRTINFQRDTRVRPLEIYVTGV